jgi:hypothetical protein
MVQYEIFETTNNKLRCGCSPLSFSLFARVVGRGGAMTEEGQTLSRPMNDGRPISAGCARLHDKM